MSKSHKAVMALKSKETRTKGCANTLVRDEVVTIMATMDFFGASDYHMAQTKFDLLNARFRLFDWIAMCINGRRKCGDGNNDEPVKVIAHAYIKSGGDIDKFIADLRQTDYDIDKSYEGVELDD